MGGWLPTVILLSAIAVVTMTPACIFTKERAIPPQGDKKVSFTELFQFIAKNKYILIFFSGVIIYTSTNVGGTLGMYLARHNFGDESVQSIIGLAAMIPGIILGMFIPKISRKIDKFYLLFFPLLMVGILDVIMYFVGYQSLTLFVVYNLVRSIPMGMVIILQSMFTPDCVEYGTYKTGIKASAIGFSIQTFSTKLAIALTATIAAAALAFIGFIEMEGAVQAVGFEDRLWFIYTLIPPIGNFLALPILWQFKLRDKDVQIMTRANRNEITREEADKLLDGRYR
jgi:Na+/melibiose symporter-like transporter